MGCTSSCKIFESFSFILEWIDRHKLGIPGILHILDDFFIIERDRASCSNSLSNFLRTCDDLGVPMAPEKTVGLSTTLSFAGIELDTLEMEARLPQKKLDKCKFIKCGYNFLITITVNHLDFIWFSSDLLHLYTDSSGSLGYGAIFGQKWFYGEWPSKWKSKNIIVLEMFPIVLSVGIWADKLANRCVMFHTDNKALAGVINKKTTKEKELLVLVRALVLFCLQHNILFKAVHLPGLFNISNLYSLNYASSSVTTYVSAIGYVHKLAGVNDPTETSVIIQLLKGYRKLALVRDVRLTITLPLLRQVIQSFEFTSSSAYQKRLLSAFCSLAFFVFVFYE